MDLTKYIYSSYVLKYNFKVFVLQLSIPILCYFILLYIWDGNIVLFTPLYIYFT